MDTILILDFGGQTTQLIGRRIRDCGVYTRIIPGDASLEPEINNEIRGVILSGSPYSVYDPQAPVPDPAVYDLEVPLLGICYGIQRIIHDQGGEVTSMAKKEYGRAEITFEETDTQHLLEGMPNRFVSWMSHGDTIKKLAPGFEVSAYSENQLPAVLENREKRIFGLQFHPEVTHCEGGEQILTNFTRNICRAKKEWNVDTYFKLIQAEIAEKVGDKNVLLLISGGVDSSVVAALLLSTLTPEQVYLMYIDTGLMRKGETEEVRDLLQELGAGHIHLIDASDRFMNALEGITDPEKKRTIIGDLFIQVQEVEIRRLKIDTAFLAQGTLYTDLVESGKGVGKKADVIKSHHNVRSPLVEEKRDQGLLIEPLSDLYKDEVRALGRYLKTPENTIRRHPFPGPGLAVRILGEVTREKCAILQGADFIYIEELKNRRLYDRIWQAFSILLPIRSVGVSGDTRRYGYVLALRAVVSKDGMTADVFPFPSLDLLEISARITNSIDAIGRVVYDISSKPPATIEWE